MEIHPAVSYNVFHLGDDPTKPAVRALRGATLPLPYTYLLKLKPLSPSAQQNIFGRHCVHCIFHRRPASQPFSQPFSQRSCIRIAYQAYPCHSVGNSRTQHSHHEVKEVCDCGSPWHGMTAHECKITHLRLAESKTGDICMAELIYNVHRTGCLCHRCESRITNAGRVMCEIHTRVGLRRVTPHLMRSNKVCNEIKFV